jgi:hypothetical protein
MSDIGTAHHTWNQQIENKESLYGIWEEIDATESRKHHSRQVKNNLGEAKALKIFTFR